MLSPTWYSPKPSYKPGELGQVEKRNLNLLKLVRDVRYDLSAEVDIEPAQPEGAPASVHRIRRDTVTVMGGG